jgi:hypothetical protein
VEEGGDKRIGGLAGSDISRFSHSRILNFRLSSLHLSGYITELLFLKFQTIHIASCLFVLAAVDRHELSQNVNHLPRFCKKVPT